jgi:PhnB protein
MQTSPHLHYPGNCREAFQSYADIFNGRIVFAMTYGESPAAAQTTPELREKIIHARLDFGGQSVLGCDAPPERYRAPQGFDVMAGIDQPAEAERVFKALAQGGKITMPFQETFWARGFGMCTDRFGIPWMINCEKPLADVAKTAGQRP